MTIDKNKILVGIGVVLTLIVFLSFIGNMLDLFTPAVGESKTYEIDGEINILKVDISAADFRIVKGEGFSVVSNLERLSLKQSGDSLVLVEMGLGNRNYNGAFLTVCIPEGTVFEKIDISTGAGRFTADVISAEKIDFELGAGEVNIGELNATREADIEGGAGQITIGGGSLNNLSIDMGVGQLDLTSKIIGEGELNLGVGEVKITLIGSREDYTLKLNRGIGNILLEGEVISDADLFGNGKNTLEINGGIGSIEVFFK